MICIYENCIFWISLLVLIYFNTYMLYAHNIVEYCIIITQFQLELCAQGTRHKLYMNFCQFVIPFLVMMWLLYVLYKFHCLFSSVKHSFKPKQQWQPVMKTYCQLRARRVLWSLFKDVPLRTRRGLLLYKVYGNSALLVLNGILLNSVNALLVLISQPRIWNIKF